VEPVKLSGAHVIITGGSSGIGLECAKLLVSQGSNVTIIARDQQKLTVAKQEINSVKKSQDVKVESFSADIGNSEEIAKVVEQAAKIHNGKIDVLIHSAAVTRPEYFAETELKYFSWLANINYLGFVYTLRAVVPFMKKGKRGRVIVVSSIVGVYAYPGYSGYGATKWALRGLVESARFELTPWNIEFSLAIPANVDTPMYEAENKYKPAEMKVLEGNYTTVKPQVVAKDIVASLTNWRYFITTGNEPFFVSTVCAGASPASFVETLAQVFLAPILKIFVRLDALGARQKLTGLLKKKE